MKNMILVLMMMVPGISLFAQNDALIIYPELNSFIKSEKANHGLLLKLNNQHPDYKGFIELYNQQNPSGKKPGTKRATFMDGPVVYSPILPVDINRDISIVHVRYSAVSGEPSAASQLLGLAATIAAGAISKGKYTGAYSPYPYNGSSTRYPDGSYRYLDSRAAIEASYLQSTYRQHDP
jgi:hypothetical protein